MHTVSVDADVIVVVVTTGDAGEVVDAGAVVVSRHPSRAFGGPDVAVPDEVLHARLRDAGLQGGGEAVAAGRLLAGRELPVGAGRYVAGLGERVGRVGGVRRG